jgi:hypothetical protein
MKKYFITSAILVGLLISSAFKNDSTKPKLFPEIEKYYSEISTAPINDSHKRSLSDLTTFILQGITGDAKANLVFACTDNSFNSISAQVVLQSLLSVNKFNKLNVLSIGYRQKDINPQLIKVLAKHGFQINDKAIVSGGQKSYEIKFGENMPTLTVYAKLTTDAGMPANNYFLMKMCDSTETACKDLTGAFFTDTLPFPTVDNTISEEEADKQFTAIATEIVYAFNKAKF